MFYIRRESLLLSEDLDEELTPDSEFKPNLLNSAMYLISLVMQISTFAINYQGLPFRESIFQNKALYNSLLVVTFVAFAAALEISSDLNDTMQLVPFEEEFRMKLLSVMVLDFGLAWLIEMICWKLFSDFKPKASLFS